MKKFNYFLLTAITIFLTTSHLNAFTTTTNFNNIQKSETLTPAFEDFSQSMILSANKDFGLEELQASTVKSTELITDNLTYLYSICVVLVLINLVVQIKIIYQMVHLFFQFQKKDEFAAFTF